MYNIIKTIYRMKGDCDCGELAKYCCPKCSANSCSLKCVKEHKAKDGCDGVRDKTEFIKLKDFSENNLVSDFRFLENVKSVSENAKRQRLVAPDPRLRQVKQVSKMSFKRNIVNKLLPTQFERSKRNTNSYDDQNDEVSWTVEWLFKESNIKHITDSVSEKSTLRSELEKHILPSPTNVVLRNSIKTYCIADFSELLVIMRAEQCPDNGYYLLDLKKSVGDNLMHKTVIEFPTFVIVTDLTDFNMIDCPEVNLSKHAAEKEPQEKKPPGKGKGRRNKKKFNNNKRQKTDIPELPENGGAEQKVKAAPKSGWASNVMDLFGTEDTVETSVEAEPVSGYMFPPRAPAWE